MISAICGAMTTRLDPCTSSPRELPIIPQQNTNKDEAVANKAQTLPLSVDTHNVSPFSRSRVEALRTRCKHAGTELMDRLENLESLQSNTTLLLQVGLSDLSDAQRRLSALEDQLQSRDEKDWNKGSSADFEQACPVVLDSGGVRATLFPEDNADETARSPLVDELTSPQKYQLDETVWETGTVVGLPVLGILDNVSIVMGLALNVFVQVLFCVIASQSFTDEGLPTTEDMKRWRYTVAHDVTWSDSTGVSLTSRVCGGDASLIVATSQLDLVEEITRYVQVLDMYFFSTRESQGLLLCTVASVIWLLLVMAEWRKSVTFMTAIWMSFRSTCTNREGVASCKKVGGLEVTVGWRRFVAMLVLVGVRLGISIALLGIGVIWILNTTSLKDVILNAAALGFVMDVDEILFVTMLTMPVKTLLRSIELPASWRCPGRPCSVGSLAGACFPCFAWLCVVALVACIVPELQRNISTMEELDYYLCHGNIDFVSSRMPTTGMILVKESETYSDMLASSYEITFIGGGRVDTSPPRLISAVVCTIGRVVFLRHIGTPGRVCARPPKIVRMLFQRIISSWLLSKRSSVSTAGIVEAYPISVRLTTAQPSAFCVQ